MRQSQNGTTKEPMGRLEIGFPWQFGELLKLAALWSPAAPQIPIFSSKVLGFEGCTRRLLSSSFLWFIFRIRQGNPKEGTTKEPIWVGFTT